MTLDPLQDEILVLLEAAGEGGCSMAEIVGGIPKELRKSGAVLEALVSLRNGKLACQKQNRHYLTTRGAVRSQTNAEAETNPSQPTITVNNTRVCACGASFSVAGHKGPGKKPVKCPACRKPLTVGQAHEIHGGSNVGRLTPDRAVAIDHVARKGNGDKEKLTAIGVRLTAQNRKAQINAQIVSLRDELKRLENFLASWRDAAMPLTPKGRKIKRAMRKTYKSDKKANEVFYASRNAGKINGVDRSKKKKKKK